MATEQNEIQHDVHIQIETASIIGTKIVDEVVHFVVSVHAHNKEWCTVKRYSNFETFHELLLTTVSSAEIPVGCALPGKKNKLWYNHQDRDFIEERTLLLDHYLLRCIQLSMTHPEVNDLFVGFLSTDAIVLEMPTFLNTKARVAQQIFPDDVEITDISINAVRVVNDHVLYQIDCSNIHREIEADWTVLKRFQQFIELDEILRSQFAHRPEITAQIFPLQRHFKWVQDHLDPHFIEHRRVLLENYLQRLLLLEPILYNEQFLDFLGIS